ncbi:hypothetical protein C8J57DRAFT_1085356, partial [Mycena rebaudengoi]
CPGIRLEWDVETFWESYPFQIHSPNYKKPPSYTLLSMEPPKARSKHCLGAVVTAEGLMPCAKCLALSIDIKILKGRADRSFEHIAADIDLNVAQLRAKLAATKENTNTLKLKNLHSTDSLARARKRETTFIDVLDFIGKNAVPGLHRLLSNAAKEGWSENKILERCKLAVEGKYIAYNYTQYEIDLTILLYELGGAGAVYAMNHSIFALPSRNTIQLYRREHKLTPSVNGVRMSDISHNISALFGPHKRRGAQAPDPEPSPIICLHTLSFDEMATERKIDYLTETDKMGGFCLEHLKALETIEVGKDTKAVEAAVAAVREGKVHISHETSVGAIARLSEKHYGAKPVFMGPSCKKGTWRDCLETMEKVLEAWKRSAYGERLYGPIKSIASDGDGKRRLALFMMCMHTEIVEGNPLYPFIKNLPGLNRRVGKDNITMDMDYKHIDKRCCTCLCSDAGVVVKSVCINRDLLLTWFERLPDHDWSESSIHALLSETSLHELLNPSDAQDVPRAIKLLLCIVEIGKLDPEDFDPGEAAEFEALCLLGEALDALLQPFINTELTLSEQIESLVKCSHLLCALYLQNGPSFIPNQLYADLQAMIKNAVLMVPKTRLINGQLKVFICLLGDDVLEALFGRCCMIGGHNPNCSISELCTRFSSAMNMDYAYQEHPELERKPRRLNLFRMRHVDHLRPANFKRELRADSCDVEIRWARGVEKAEAILKKFGVQMSVPFGVLFKRKDTDLLRPFGGKYPAISQDVDRSLSSNNITDASQGLDPDITSPSNLMANVDFDALIAQEEAQQSAEAQPHSLFAEINADGHVRHKKAIVRTLFDMTQDSHDAVDASVSTHLQLGNLFATLICYNGTNLGLALAKCTLIKKAPAGSKSTSVSAVPRAELDLPASPYTFYGQALSLIPLCHSTGNQHWAWDGQFISFSLKKKQKANSAEVSRLKNLQFSVSSRLVDPIHEKAYKTSTLNNDEVSGGRDNTWAFSNDVLLASWNRLWVRLLGDKTLHDKFPNFTGVDNGVFPYQTAASAGDEESRGIFYSSPIANTPLHQSAIQRDTCRICHKTVKDGDRQTHVGMHIIKSLLGVHDSSAKTPVSSDYPCGTCGGPALQGACRIGIKGAKANSDCPCTYSFLISAAAKFPDSRPCTNIPIQCPLDCNEIHWKYNFPAHFRDRHPSWRQILPATFIPQIEVSRAEQVAQHIPEHKVVQWPCLQVAPVLSSQPSNILGNKRDSNSLLGSRCRNNSDDKENQVPEDSGRAAKIMRLH